MALAVFEPAPLLTALGRLLLAGALGSRPQPCGKNPVFTGVRFQLWLARSKTSRKLHHRMESSEPQSDSDPAAQQLQAADTNRAAVEGDQSVSALLGMISHELSTPLQTVLVNAELIGGMQLTSEARTALDRLERAVEVTLMRLDNITRYAKLSTDSQEAIERRAFRIGDLIRDVVDGCESESRRNNKRIVVDCGKYEGEIEGDPGRLHQILTNYVDNAVRHSGAATIHVKSSTIPGGDGRPELLEVSVTDSGTGVSPADRETIWHPFVRASAGRKKPGMGLGLAVVKMLASSAGWDVGLRESGPGTTTFYVRLPLRP